MSTELAWDIPFITFPDPKRSGPLPLVSTLQLGNPVLEAPAPRVMKDWKPELGNELNRDYNFSYS
jgi:hypothetical protein